MAVQYNLTSLSAGLLVNDILSNDEGVSAVSNDVFPVVSEPDAVLPYICYIYPDEAGLGADNINYKPITSVQVELYSYLKDPASEAKIEAALTNNSIYYTKDSTYLDDQQAWMTVYTFEVI